MPFIIRFLLFPSKTIIIHAHPGKMIKSHISLFVVKLYIIFLFILKSIYRKPDPVITNFGQSCTKSKIKLSCYITWTGIDLSISKSSTIRSIYPPNKTTAFCSISSPKIISFRLKISTQCITHNIWIK